MHGCGYHREWDTKSYVVVVFNDYSPIPLFCPVQTQNQANPSKNQASSMSQKGYLIVSHRKNSKRSVGVLCRLGEIDGAKQFFYPATCKADSETEGVIST
jgi:hypothetical protein